MNPLPPKIESFIVLTTVSDQQLANKLCAALEQADVPLLVEHVELIDQGRSRVGYRLLSPSSVRETAMSIVDINMSIHQTRGLITTRPDELTIPVSSKN